MTSPKEPHSRVYSHINGSADELLDRLAVSELCKGWPVYRDASEWMNLRSLFCDEAYVWTTWSGPKTIDDFIALSREGKARGAHIQHRECGTLVELDPLTSRAVGKMKATITQRFRAPLLPQARGADGNGRNGHPVRKDPEIAIGGAAKELAHDAEEKNGGDGAGEKQDDTAREAQAEVEYDVDCDVRFIFFCTKEQLPLSHHHPSTLSTPSTPSTPSTTIAPPTAWRVKYVKLIYEKDKLVPVDGTTVPRFDPEELAVLPEGYRYLGAAQRRLGYDVDPGLVTLREEDGWGRMYASVERWLGGGEAGLFW